MLVYLAAFSFFEEAAGTGIRFFRYMDGFLHQKVVLVDDEIASVGTANFDNRSFRLNFEIMAVVAEPGFAPKSSRCCSTTSKNRWRCSRATTRIGRFGSSSPYALRG